MSAEIPALISKSAVTVGNATIDESRIHHAVESKPYPTSPTSLPASTLKALDWEIVEVTPPTLLSEQSIAHRETVFCIGNGYIGIRGATAFVPPQGSRVRASHSTRGDIAGTGAGTGPSDFGDQYHAHSGVASPPNSSHGLNALRHQSAQLDGTTASTDGTAATPAATGNEKRGAKKKLIVNPSVYIQGVYDEKPTDIPTNREYSFGACTTESLIVGVQDPFRVSIYVGGELFSLASGRVLSYRRCLDMRRAAMVEQVVWEAPQSKVVDIQATRFASFSKDSTAAMQVLVRAVNFSGSEVRIVSHTMVPERSNPDSKMQLSTEVGVFPTDTHVQDTETESSVCVGVRTNSNRIDIQCNTCATCHVIEAPPIAGGSSSSVPLSSSQTNSVTGPVLSSSMHGVSHTSGWNPLSSSSHNPLGDRDSSQQLTSIVSPIGTGTIPLPSLYQHQHHASTAHHGRGHHTHYIPHELSSAFSTPFPSVSTAPGANVMVITPRALLVESDDQTNIHNASFSTVVDKGHIVCFTKFAAYATSRDHAPEDLIDVAKARLDVVAKNVAYNALLAEQTVHVSNYWSLADVKISDGNERGEDQGVLRMNLIHLLMSAGTRQWTNFAAKGLTGELFGGHYSWDSEIFILPCFVHTHLPAAQAMIRFRIDTLQSAMDRATDLELSRGALYPFRTLSGTETSCSSPYTLQLHINSDIAYAIKLYLDVTNDFDMILNGAAAVVLATALVWIEWGVWDRGDFHLRLVTGPDEYNVLVNDNYYTNILAQQHLYFAVDLVRKIEHNYPQHWQVLKERVKWNNDDLKAMLEAAKNMALPFDSKLHVHLQDESFIKKKEWNTLREHLNLNAASAASSVEHPLTQVCHPLTVYRHRVCKQADVLLSQILCSDKFTFDEKIANFNFYESLTTHDSSLSFHTFSITASELGYYPKSYDYFVKSLYLDFHNTIGNSGSGIHAANMAGSWSCVAKGFAGLRVINGCLHFNPYCPEKWNEYTFKIRYLNSTIQVTVTRRFVKYLVVECARGAATKTRVVHAGIPVHLAKGKPVQFNLFKEVPSLDFDAVIFDLHTIIPYVEEDHYAAWKAVLDPFFTYYKNNWAELGGGAQQQLLLSDETASFANANITSSSIVDDRELTREQYLAYIRHHPMLGKRYYGLSKLFASRSIHIPYGEASDGPDIVSLCGLGCKKLIRFREVFSNKGAVAAEGVAELLSQLRKNGIGIGWVSSSKNGWWMLRQSDLANAFDCFIDGNAGEEKQLEWKPEAQFFSACTKKLGANRNKTVIVMSSVSGFSKNALNHYALLWSVNSDGNTLQELRGVGVDVVEPSFTGVTPDVVDEWLQAKTRNTEIPFSVAAMSSAGGGNDKLSTSGDRASAIAAGQGQKPQQGGAGIAPGGNPTDQPPFIAITTAQASSNNIVGQYHVQRDTPPHPPIVMSAGGDAATSRQNSPKNSILPSSTGKNTNTGGGNNTAGGNPVVQT